MPAQCFGDSSAARRTAHRRPRSRHTFGPKESAKRIFAETDKSLGTGRREAVRVNRLPVSCRDFPDFVTLESQASQRPAVCRGL